MGASFRASFRSRPRSVNTGSLGSGKRPEAEARRRNGAGVGVSKSFEDDEETVARARNRSEACRRIKPSVRRR